MQMLDALPWLSALIVVFSVLFLGVITYLGTRLVLRRRASKDTETLANSIIFRTASMHALILALVFAQEQINVVDLRRTVAQEAAAAADIFYDLGRYDPAADAPLQRALATYVKVVIEEEWETLVDGHLSQRAWDLWEQVYEGVLDLAPKNLRQDALRARMLADIETISESRNLRRADYRSGVTLLFWTVAILGVVVVVIPYFVFRAGLVNLLLLGVFAAYNGVVIYLIFAMSNPYSPPGAVEPLPFIEIFQHDMSALLRAGG